jgi:hypothetical protein
MPMADQVLSGIKSALRDPSTVRKGAMRKIENRDELARITSTEYVGQTSFVRDAAMGHREPRRVKNFLGADNRPLLY